MEDAGHFDGPDRVLGAGGGLHSGRLAHHLYRGSRRDRPAPHGDDPAVGGGPGGGAGPQRPVIALTNRGGTGAFRIRAAWQGQLPEPGIEIGFANPGDTIEWTAPGRPTARPDAGPQLLAVWWIVPADNQDRSGSEYVPVYLPPLRAAAQA